jgi:histone-lysine N-methyltransferase SETMAR
MEHPPYSPDLSPPDFDGFSRIKRPNKGTRFNNFDELKSSYECVINELNKKNEFTGIDDLPERWESVVQALGDYIE